MTEIPAALDALGVPRPRPLLVLVGGAGGMDEATRQVLAGVLRALTPEESEAAVGLLLGSIRQGSIGLGYRTVLGARDAATPAAEPSLTVGEKWWMPVMVASVAAVMPAPYVAGVVEQGRRSAPAPPSVPCPA